ncbi:MAG: hypothetical protein WCA84_11790 [Ignavibacteriaceae bacterium]
MWFFGKNKTLKTKQSQNIKKELLIPYSSVRYKYLLIKESYRPLAEEYFNRSTPDRAEWQRELESYKMMVDEVTKKLFENYVDKFIVHYFCDHAELDLTEFTKIIEDDKKLQIYIDVHFSNLRELLEGFAQAYLSSGKK